MEGVYLPYEASNGTIGRGWLWKNGHSHPSSSEPIVACRPFTASPRCRTPDPRDFMVRRSRLLGTYRGIMASPAASFTHPVNAWISMGGRSSDWMSWWLMMLKLCSSNILLVKTAPMGPNKAFRPQGYSPRISKTLSRNGFVHVGTCSIVEGLVSAFLDFNVNCWLVMIWSTSLLIMVFSIN